jgi:hypothetical protein
MATAHAPGFPLPLRNALAHLVIAALADADADAALAWLAAGTGVPTPAARERLAALHVVETDGTLLDVHQPHVERVRGHATRALRAVGAFRRRRTATDEGCVAAAIDRAIALWNEQLFFEVHEVLEAEWQHATGDERQALQGVIQIGVALHHHAHGNLRGARTLMRDGRERLGATRDALPTLDAGALLAATAPWEAALTAGGAAPSLVPTLGRATRPGA